MRISWCTDPSLATLLADFFAANVGPAYISHGEVQGGRAVSLKRWSPRLRQVMAREFRAYASTRGISSAGIRLAVAWEGRRPVAIAVVELVKGRGPCYAVLDDLVVDGATRGRGLGGRMLRWVEAGMRRAGAKRVFLESGLMNTAAHDFFHRHGFNQSSIVMVKELAAR